MTAFDGEGIAAVGRADWLATRGKPGLFHYATADKRHWLIYKIGAESNGGSDYPPPSLQNRLVVAMYAERDGWMCHLCHGPIEQGSTYGGRDRHAASPDHVTPRADGGTDHPSNIKTAHLSCNKGRGRKPLLNTFSVSDSPPTHHALTEDVHTDSHPEGKGGEGKGSRKGNGALLPRALRALALDTPTALPAPCEELEFASQVQTARASVAGSGRGER